MRAVLVGGGGVESTWLEVLRSRYACSLHFYPPFGQEASSEGLKERSRANYKGLSQRTFFFFFFFFFSEDLSDLRLRVISFFISDSLLYQAEES